MIGFAALSITLLSAAFALGGVTYLYIRHRTRFLRLVLLFLVSLLAITAGFWVDSKPFHRLGLFRTGMETLHWVLSAFGSWLNIAVLPFLVSALLAFPLPGFIKPGLWIWSSSFLLVAVFAFLFPALNALPVILTGQQIATIAGALLFMGIGIRRVKRPWWRKAFILFFTVSALFFGLLVLDVLISLIPIAELRYFDNLSLPVYLAALNIGIFYFSGKYLSREALVQDQRLTPACVDFYRLTARETQIIEEIINGRSNKDIGERLFISPKTVENHLYNIYQKLDVTSRTQLLHLLYTWGRE